MSDITRIQNSLAAGEVQASEDPVKAEVVKLRYFISLKNAEIAEALDISVSTVERYWAYAKAWLFERIQRE